MGMIHFAIRKNMNSRNMRASANAHVISFFNAFKATEGHVLKFYAPKEFKASCLHDYGALFRP